MNVEFLKNVFIRWVSILVLYIVLAIVFCYAENHVVILPTVSFGDTTRLIILFAFVLFMTIVFPALALILYPVFAFYFVYPYGLILHRNPYIAGFFTLSIFYDVLLAFIIAFILGVFLYKKVSIVYELLGGKI